MFKTNFSGQTKLGGHRKNLMGHCPRMPAVATGQTITILTNW